VPAAVAAAEGVALVTVASSLVPPSAAAAAASPAALSLSAWARAAETALAAVSYCW